MKSFLKRALFWTLFIPLGLIMVLINIPAGFLEWLCDRYDEMLDKYEWWTFSEELAYGKHNDNYKRNA